MAANNQALKGNCALLTQAPKIKNNKPNLILTLKKFLVDTKDNKNKTKNKSPMRF